MKHGSKLLIGITGQTGGGKTLVGSLLTKYGYSVIDADIVSRKVVEPGTPCLAKLVNLFGGENILLSNGSLNRAGLGDIVFNDDSKRYLLNNTIYPYIISEISNQVNALRAHGYNSIFLDAPTLFESGIDEHCDKIVSIIAPRKLRTQRILARDSITPEQAEARLSSQHDDEYYTSRSDYVIENKGKPHELENHVIDMLHFFGLSEKNR